MPGHGENRARTGFVPSWKLASYTGDAARLLGAGRRNSRRSDRNQTDLTAVERAREISRTSRGAATTMSQPRLNRIHKAAALVPLAILSGAWTRQPRHDERQRNPPTETTTAAPASIGARPDRRGTGERQGHRPTTSPRSPSAARSEHGHHGQRQRHPRGRPGAYQRSAQILASADSSCGLDWTLLAAIGRVESNHGRVGGSTSTPRAGHARHLRRSARRHPQHRARPRHRRRPVRPRPGLRPCGRPHAVHPEHLVDRRGGRRR